MPSSVCCTNCRTKYSLLNREAGCSNCARSFCKKCLGYRSIIPNLSSQPMIVCYECYQKIEAAKLKPEAVITSTPLPSGSSRSQNWWGEGLPPPSFRNTYNNPPTTSTQFRPQPPPKPSRQVPQQAHQHPQVDDLEQRISKLKDEPKEPPSMEELEERLAKLRGCDVELIRNPKSWFTSSSGIEMNAQTPADLMKMAQDRARIEEKEETAEREELEELDARKRKVFEMEEQKEGEEERNVRESVVSGETEFSEATKEEMNEINNMLFDAEKRVAETKKQEKHDAAEMRTLMRNTRQKSLDAMQWNDKITKEIGGFWDRRNEKNAEMEEDEDEKSLDEETFKKILHEAENSEDVPPPTTTTKSPEAQSSSPKKKGFFEKLFRKDSKQ